MKISNSNRIVVEEKKSDDNYQSNSNSRHNSDQIISPSPSKVRQEHKEVDVETNPSLSFRDEARSMLEEQTPRPTKNLNDRNKTYRPNGSGLGTTGRLHEHIRGHTPPMIDDDETAIKKEIIHSNKSYPNPIQTQNQSQGQSQQPNQNQPQKNRNKPKDNNESGDSSSSGDDMEAINLDSNKRIVRRQLPPSRRPSGGSDSASNNQSQSQPKSNNESQKNDTKSIETEEKENTTVNTTKKAMPSMAAPRRAKDALAETTDSNNSYRRPSIDEIIRSQPRKVSIELSDSEEDEQMDFKVIIELIESLLMTLRLIYVCVECYGCYSMFVELFTSQMFLV